MELTEKEAVEGAIKTEESIRSKLKNPLFMIQFRIAFWVFLSLKLSGNIDWSWWWVCSPAIFRSSLMLTSAVIVNYSSKLRKQLREL